MNQNLIDIASSPLFNLTNRHGLVLHFLTKGKVQIQEQHQINILDRQDQD